MRHQLQVFFEWGSLIHLGNVSTGLPPPSPIPRRTHYRFHKILRIIFQPNTNATVRLTLIDSSHNNVKRVVSKAEINAPEEKINAQTSSINTFELSDKTFLFLHN